MIIHGIVNKSSLIIIYGIITDQLFLYLGMSLSQSVCTIIFLKPHINVSTFPPQFCILCLINAM